MLLATLNRIRSKESAMFVALMRNAVVVVAAAAIVGYMSSAKANPHGSWGTAMAVSGT